MSRDEATLLDMIGASRLIIEFSTTWIERLCTMMRKLSRPFCIS